MSRRAVSPGGRGLRVQGLALSPHSCLCRLHVSLVPRGKAQGPFNARASFPRPETREQWPLPRAPGPTLRHSPPSPANLLRRARVGRVPRLGYSQRCPQLHQSPARPHSQLYALDPTVVFGHWTFHQLLSRRLNTSQGHAFYQGVVRPSPGEHDEIRKPRTM